MAKQDLKSTEYLEELEELRHQLYEANETIEAIRKGQIDALIVEGENGNELYTLKTADHAYRVFIEKMAEGAVTLNQQGVITFCNLQFATMIGKALSVVIGSRLENFVTEDCKENFISLFHRCWISDCKEELMIKDGGRDIPVQLSLTAMELEGELALSIIVTDLTMQKKSQQLLEENYQKLEIMNRALEMSNHDLQQFASVASHDLQEPLRKIQMFSSLLKDATAGHFDADKKRHLDKIIYSAGRMKALVMDVLNYSKLSAKENTFELVDLNELIRELLEDFELLIQEKDAVIMVDELPLITANKGQIRQAFHNLLSNALKFSRQGTNPQINITAKRILEKSFDSEFSENGPFCLIGVKDNGIGFDEKYLHLIFALFERLHSKDSYEGTGIGLSITKKIIEKHHGLIKAMSEGGNGAEFLLLLPIEQKLTL